MGGVCPHSASHTSTHPQIALKLKIASGILQVPDKLENIIIEKLKKMLPSHAQITHFNKIRDISRYEGLGYISARLEWLKTKYGSPWDRDSTESVDRFFSLPTSLALELDIFTNFSKSSWDGYHRFYKNITIPSIIDVNELVKLQASFKRQLIDAVITNLNDLPKYTQENGTRRISTH